MRAVGPILVGVDAPVLGEDLRLEERVEEQPVEMLVAKAPIE